MIIKAVHVDKFRGFQNVGFNLGKQLTLIAGQNGTQKSTLLGMLTQTFSIPSSHIMHAEKPLCGGNFRSNFKDKFKLSPKYDIAKAHEWTIDFYGDTESFTIESMLRTTSTNEIRFWKKGDRSAGSGYVHFPVIFLSLKRLLPSAEESSLAEDTSIVLTDNETTFYKKWYNKILLSLDKVEKVSYLKSKNKETVGVDSDHYDWLSNSAGQDNIGKIILAIISFKRLKEKFGNAYEGGILAIDEIDATLFPGAQAKLVDALLKFCSLFSIQVIATTHSMSMIERLLDISGNVKRKDDVKLVYLKKVDKQVVVEEDLNANRLKNHLNVSLGNAVKLTVDVFAEDEECRDFSKATLGRKYTSLKYVDCTLGCENLLQLAKQKIPAFLHPNSIVVLDGDVSPQKIKNFQNFIMLPGGDSPEKVLANFLWNLSDGDSFWSEKNTNYNKQICFRDSTLEDIENCRIKAKAWYRKQKKDGVWGIGASTLYKRYFKYFPLAKQNYIDTFGEIYSEIVESKGF
jgi:AAA15 family ATPase/GTPase